MYMVATGVANLVFTDKKAIIRKIVTSIKSIVKAEVGFEFIYWNRRFAKCR